MLRDHTDLFGEDVHLEIFRGSTVSEPTTSTNATSRFLGDQFKITVEHQIAVAIHKCPAKLANFVAALNVDFEVQMEHICITPRANACSGWREKCQNFVQKTFIKCEMKILNETAKEMVSQFTLERDKEDSAFYFEPNSSKDECTALYTVAGDVEVISALQEHQKRLESPSTDEIKIRGDQYDYICQIMIEELRSEHPAVIIDLQETKMHLKGSLVHVDQLKRKVTAVVNDLQTISVDLDLKLVSHFASAEGRKQIKAYLAVSECHFAVSFSCHEYCQPANSKLPTVELTALKMAIVYPSVHGGWAKNIKKVLEREAAYEKVDIPALIAPMFQDKMQDMQDFNSLKTQLQRVHGTKIIYEESTTKAHLFIYGFNTDGIKTTTTELCKFFDKKVSLSKPIQISLRSETFCGAFIKKPHQIKAILASISSNLTYSFSDENVLSVTSENPIESDLRDKCKTALKSYFDQFNTIELAFNREAVEEIRKLLVETEKSSKFPFNYDLQEEDTIVEIVGDSRLVDTLNTKVKQKSDSFTDLSREISLQPLHFAYLQQVKLQLIAKSHPELKLSLDGSKGCLNVVGPKAKVGHFEKCLHEEYLKVTTIGLECKNPLIAEFLSEGSGKEFLLNFLKTKTQNSVAFFPTKAKHPDIHFVWDSASDETFIPIVDELRVRVTCKAVSFPKTSIKMNTKLIELKKKLENDYKVICQLNLMEFSLTLAGLLEAVERADERIKRFIVSECTIKKELQLSSHEWRLLKEQKSIYNDVSIKIQSGEKSSENSVILQFEGAEFAVNSVYSQLLTLKSSIKTGSIKVFAPAACKFFQNGTTVLTGVEATYKVCIETVLIETEESEVEIEKFSNPTTQEYCRISLMFEDTKNVVTFRVCIGDITDFSADVLVNPANKDLKHGTGVAGAIVSKGGPEIQRDCDKYIMEQKIGYGLNEGDVYFSKTQGNLPCKAIAHAVGPMYKKDVQTHDYEESRLMLAVANSLKYAARFRFGSIAFPAISSGVFQYPIDECALAHIKASTMFFSKTKCTLTDVSYIVVSAINAEAFYNALSKCLPGHNIIKHDASNLCVLQESDLLDFSMASSNTVMPSHHPRRKAMASVMKLPYLHQGDLFKAKVSP